MKINSVAILGAGAVGSYMIWGLSSKKDLRLGVIGEGKRTKRLKQGCFINDQMYYPEVWSSQEAHNVDLLIVSLKYGALKPALDSIKTIVGKNTTVMSLMNGVESEEIIGEVVGNEHVLPALIKVVHVKKMAIVLILKPQLELFSEKNKLLFKVNVFKRLKTYLKIPVYTIVQVNLFKKKFGVSFV